MKSNKKKCWILHLGWSNAGHKGEKWLEISLAERDLGVLVDSRLNRAVHSGSQEGKQYPGVHQTQYNQPVKRGDYPTVFTVGLTLSAVHSPGRCNFRRMCECVQRRAIRLVKGLEGMSYGKRLRALGLFSLEK